MNAYGHENAQTSADSDDAPSTVFSGGRRRWVVLATTAAFLAGAWAYLTYTPTTYRCASRLYVESAAPRGVALDSAGIASPTKSYLCTQAELLKSSPVLTDALGQPGVAATEAFPGSTNLLADLKKDLDVEVGKKDDLITISLDSRNGAAAARIVNGVVQAYVRHCASQKRSTSGELLKVLRQELAAREADRSRLSQSMRDFRQASGTLSFENDKSNLAVSQLSRLWEALASAQIRTIEARANYEAAAALRDDPARARMFIEAHATDGKYIAADRQDVQFRADVSAMQLKLIALRQDLTDDHPAVQSLKQAIAEGQQRIGEMDRALAETYLASAGQALAAARQKEAEIQAAVDRQQRTAREQD